jgi:hypothetical protein
MFNSHNVTNLFAGFIAAFRSAPYPRQQHEALRRRERICG